MEDLRSWFGFQFGNVSFEREENIEHLYYFVLNVSWFEVITMYFIGSVCQRSFDWIRLIWQDCRAFGGKWLRVFYAPNCMQGWHRFDSDNELVTRDDRCWFLWWCKLGWGASVIKYSHFRDSWHCQLEVLASEDDLIL